MKVRAQFALIFNLDKCIGCHTCSVSCKNVWTSREGVEYAWFNNVETKPGVGFPQNWEDQDKWNGGWELKKGKLQLKSGSKFKRLLNIFANPDLPEIDDYYEPFTYNYTHLQNAPLSEATPTARPISQITGDVMEKITWGPNWEDDLAGAFSKRAKDKNMNIVQKEMYSEFENTFQMYLPRICNHCLNASCIASCPSGSIYKREEDGIVLVDQDKCRGWRMCVSACPYKKIFYNWESGKAEKCNGCYPRVESGMPTLCSESCVGRIRYNGFMLYDADRIEEVASMDDTQDLYEAQCSIFLDPHDPEVIAAARRDGINDDMLEATQKSPIWKIAMDWKLAFPIHPEFRTLPMVWYVPPLSPVQSRIDQDQLPTGPDGVIPVADAMRLPVQYLANLLTAGKEAPIESAFNRLIAMRSYMRSVTVEGVADTTALEVAGLTEEQAKEMYRYLAIANYEDRFVIPTGHEEMVLDDAFANQGQSGFSFGNNSSPGVSKITLFPRRHKTETKDLAPSGEKLSGK